MYCGFFLTFLQNLQRQYLPGHQCPNICIWLLRFPKKCPFLCFCFCWQSTEHFSRSFFPLVMHQNESPFVLLPLVIRSFQSRYIFCSGYSAFQMCVLLAFVQHFNVSWSFYLIFFPPYFPLQSIWTFLFVPFLLLWISTSSVTQCPSTYFLTWVTSALHSLVAFPKSVPSTILCGFGSLSQQWQSAIILYFHITYLTH